jgi:hypothetical protein
MRPGPAVLIPCIALVASCGREPVTIISSGPDGGSPTVDAAALCPSSLAARLKIYDIPVGKNIAWQKAGYSQFPVDERVALAIQSDGQAYIAWGEVNAATAGDVTQPSPLGVHVTSLGADFVAKGDDVPLPTAQEVGGLVAHDDGFAVLVRDVNQGAAIDLGDGATVAHLVRYRYGKQDWRVPLTGSLSLGADETKTVYSPFLDGQLTWDESTYGAYFVVRGGSTDPAAGFWRDLLVFRQSLGSPATLELSHGCQNNGGLRLIADPNRANPLGLKNLPQMTGICVQQAAADLKLTGLEGDKVISSQEVEWRGYSGAKLGSLVKVDGGYLVFWLSLGAINDHQGHDIRMARLDANFNVTVGPTWVTKTPGVEEWNLHVVPYGKDQFLMLYQEIAITRPADDSDWAMYLGNYTGTRARLIASDGTLAPSELLPDAGITANAEPVVLPGSRDVVWPFVNPSPDYTQKVAGPNGPGQTVLHVARLSNCP